jgi:hypothetical protein
MKKFAISIILASNLVLQNLQIIIVQIEVVEVVFVLLRGGNLTQNQDSMGLDTVLRLSRGGESAAPLLRLRLCKAKKTLKNQEN